MANSENSKGKPSPKIVENRRAEEFLSADEFPPPPSGVFEEPPGGNIRGYRQTFMSPLVNYFKHLEQKLVDELATPGEASDEDNDGEFPDIIADDKLQFDEQSINAALGLCRLLDDYIKNKLTDEEFDAIQSVFLFYESPEQLLDMVKLLFLGNLIAKEKVVRIYGSKVFGTFKVVQMLLETSELFEGFTEEEENKIKRDLQMYAESPLRQFKKFFLTSEQLQIPNTGVKLANGVRSTLSQKDPLFGKDDDYNLILEHFKDFIFCLYGTPFVLKYVKLKDQYMRNWLHNELYTLDIQNMHAGPAKVPQINMLKLKVYHQLEGLFAKLDRADRLYDKSLLLKKTHDRIMSQGEAYLKSGDEPEKKALIRARAAEKKLLDSLNPVQISCIAERVHSEISQIRTNKTLEGTAPTNSEMRSVEMGSEKSAEKKYMAATVKIQATQAKLRNKTLTPSFFQAMGKLAKVLNILPKKDPVVEENEKTPIEIKVIPRAEGNKKGPLKSVEVDWIGFGKEFKSTVYERSYPNLQQRFFEHGSLNLYLQENFRALVESVFQYYGSLDYIETKTHRMGFSGGGGTVKQFVDSVIYLKIDQDSFIAIGNTPFSKDTLPIAYFQIYRTNVFRVKKGSLAKIDYSKKVRNTLFQLEDIENSVQLRPLLFTYLIKIIDSFPDEIRDNHQTMLRAMAKYLNTSKESEDQKKSS